MRFIKCLSSLPNATDVARRCKRSAIQRSFSLASWPPPKHRSHLRSRNRRNFGEGEDCSIGRNDGHHLFGEGQKSFIQCILQLWLRTTCFYFQTWQSSSTGRNCSRIGGLSPLLLLLLHGSYFADLQKRIFVGRIKKVRASLSQAYWAGKATVWRNKSRFLQKFNFSL